MPHSEGLLAFSVGPYDSCTEEPLSTDSTLSLTVWRMKEFSGLGHACLALDSKCVCLYMFTVIAGMITDLQKASTRSSLVLETIGLPHARERSAATSTDSKPLDFRGQTSKAWVVPR